MDLWPKVKWSESLHLPPCSAILYLNDDFDGGDFFFTELDAKTVTVSSTFFMQITQSKKIE